ncbi:MAG TPA: glycosyltransferase family 4 protein [Bacteroidia bacterium]
MSSNKPTLVIVTQSLNRTGSELVLFNLLPYIKDHFSITLLSVFKGELYNELPSYVHKDYLYAKPAVGLLGKIAKRLKDSFVVPGKLKKYAKGTWYINTIVLPDYVKFAEENNIPCIVHTHELEQMYKLLTPEQTQRLVNYPRLVIANSKISADTITKFGRTKPIEVCYPAFDTRKITGAKFNPGEIRKKLGIKEEEFVWTMCGTIDDNKNPFLFVYVALEIKKSSTHLVKFVWIGNTPSGNDQYAGEVKKYVEDLGMSESILWIENTRSNFHEYFSVADGFILTSQFESFSLVTLEALLLGLPVVANKCGGVNEILDNKCGYILEQKNNVEEMAAKMLEYMKNPIDEKERSEQIQFAQRFDISVWGVKWKDIILKYIAHA